MGAVIIKYWLYCRAKFSGEYSRHALCAVGAFVPAAQSFLGGEGRLQRGLFGLLLLVLLAACAGAGGSSAITGVTTQLPQPGQGLPATAVQVLSPVGQTAVPATHVPAALVSATPTILRTPTGLPTQTDTPAPVITATPTPPTCLNESGQIVTGSLRADFLRLPLDYRIYLPPCYGQQLDRRYPVLYLFHGQSFNDDQWDRLGADEMVDALVAAGQIAPFMIVMPRDRTGDQPPEDGVARAVVEVLLPLVDREFRTLADRDHRAVGGLSRGAGWSVHLGLVYWQLFGAVGAHSPAIFHEDARLMRVILDKIPKESLPRIFIDVGDRDRPEISDSAIWFEKVLDEKDVAHDWYLFPGYHEEAYWQAHLEKYIRWYAKEW